MPGNPKAIVADAERRFPVRIIVKGGLGALYLQISDWLDEHCGVNGWATASRRGALGEDGTAVFLNNPTCAVASVARWCVLGDPSGFYELRQDQPAKRVPLPAHKSPL
jgi:hypothetical protein